MLIVTDKFDDNVFLSSRNLPDVLVLETREVDPVSLVRFNNVLLTKRALRNSRRCWDERRQAGNTTPSACALVLLAPVVSEKGTFIADKHEQVIFKVLPDATKPEVKAAVELMFKVEVESVQIVNVRARRSASAASRAAAALEKGLRVPEARPGNQLRGRESRQCHCKKSNRHHPAAARWSRS